MRFLATLISRIGPTWRLVAALLIVHWWQQAAASELEEYYTYMLTKRPSSNGVSFPYNAKKSIGQCVIDTQDKLFLINFKFWEGYLSFYHQNSEDMVLRTYSKLQSAFSLFKQKNCITELSWKFCSLDENLLMSKSIITLNDVREQRFKVPGALNCPRVTGEIRIFHSSIIISGTKIYSDLVVDEIVDDRVVKVIILGNCKLRISLSRYYYQP